MSTSLVPASPQARLARNRAAFAEALGGPQRPLPNGDPPPPAGAPRRTPLAPRSLLRRGLRAWWRAHPARVAVQMAEPAFRDIARERPWPLLGAAAGIGALLVLTRPWRLLTAGAVTAAALRPVGLSGLLAGVLGVLADAGPPPAEEGDPR